VVDRRHHIAWGRAMLTIQAVLNAKPHGKGYKLGDGGGLYLYVTPSGRKSWRMKYRYGGLEKLLTFGLFPEVTIVQARQKRDAARLALKQGQDPAAEILKQKRADVLAAGATFGQLARQWLIDQERHWASATALRIRNRMEKDILAALGDLPVQRVTSTHILKQLRKIEAKGSIETAKRVKNDVLAILRRARGERLISPELIIDLEYLADALKPNPPVRRQPALTTVSDLLDFQQTVDRSTGHLTTKLASRFVALTLVRMSTLRLATWSEFSGIDWNNPDSPSDEAKWTIPAAHMKLTVKDKANVLYGHDVPLSRQAVEILRTVRIVNGRSPYVFPKANAWREPMTDSALSGLYRRMADARFKNRMVPHGWRAAFSTIMNERAALLDREGDRMIIDMILAHVPRGLSASEWAYNRARCYKPRAALYQIWADMITEGLPTDTSLLKRLGGAGRGCGARASR
jgi:hypothetical protein